MKMNSEKFIKATTDKRNCRWVTSFILLVIRIHVYGRKFRHCILKTDYRTKFMGDDNRRKSSLLDLSKMETEKGGNFL